jgi:hypothetical protein
MFSCTSGDDAGPTGHVGCWCNQAGTSVTDSSHQARISRGAASSPAWPPPLHRSACRNRPAHSRDSPGVTTHRVQEFSAVRQNIGACATDWWLLVEGMPYQGGCRRQAG